MPAIARRSANNLFNENGNNHALFSTDHSSHGYRFIDRSAQLRRWLLKACRPAKTSLRCGLVAK
ncbi:hypothetical protein CU666_25060, partial [Pseudomonas syringae pv. actinidifoliorum]|nr:hypothetical protein [Pseudomonas syringae pv. actinidifoliorum]